jgi:hypothetical protein
MPNYDEGQQDRQDYAPPSGWKPSADKVDASGYSGPGAQAASPPADAEAAPSAEQEAASDAQVSEQATPPTSQPEQKKFNMPPPERWAEVIKQKEEAERRASEAQRLAELALQKLQTPTAHVQPEPYPYAGMDDATANWYRRMDARMEERAAKIADQKLQGVLQSLNIGRQELAAIKVAQFRKDNPEIAQGSPEEAAIAGYVQGGMDLDTAKKLALYDKLEAENRALKGKQAAIPRKVAASNAESSSGIPAGAGLPPKQGDWRDKASEILDKGGNLQDVLHNVFGGRR